MAEKASENLLELQERGDRGEAIEVMGKGAALILSDLLAKNKVDGVISMGGGGGTYIALTAMQIVPFGIPKLCISTLATKDLSEYIGSKDIMLVPSIVDVAGLNKISRVVTEQAANALLGMLKKTNISSSFQPKSIAISVFGNTTLCVDRCSELLKEKNYEVLAFHAVGVGGRTMESLIEEKCFDAVLDITTTELADELCGGICAAGSNRLTAAAAIGIPQVIVPGCLDMVNFGTLDSVPEKYKNRELFSWAPDVTLMRTNEEENIILGLQLAEKANKSIGKVSVLLPLKGISKISAEGGVFYNPKLDELLFTTIKMNLKPSINIIEINANINTVFFAEQTVKELLKLMLVDS